MALFKFPTDLKQIKEASKKVLDAFNDLKLNPSVLFDLKLCFEEALINAIKYGNKNDSRLSVDVEIIKRKDEVEIVVRDQGDGFDYEHGSDPTTDDNLAKTSGRGVFLIKHLMDKVIFERNGSCLRMIKKIRGNSLKIS